MSRFNLKINHKSIFSQGNSTFHCFLDSKTVKDGFLGEADNVTCIKNSFYVFWRHDTYLNESGPNGLWFFILFVMPQPKRKLPQDPILPSLYLTNSALYSLHTTTFLSYYQIDLREYIFLFNPEGKMINMRAPYYSRRDGKNESGFRQLPKVRRNKKEK